MVKRFLAVVLSLWFASCQTPPPINASSSFSASPALALRNPSDIAVLPVEDGSSEQVASRHLDYMRQALQRQLPARLYVPLAPELVDAAMLKNQPKEGETLMTPAYLKRIAGKATEEAALAVRVNRWDESHLLTDKKVDFEIQAVLVANDGEVLWSGNLSGSVKSGGFSAAPRDRDQMGRSCAELAMIEVLNHLQRRRAGGG